MGLQSTTGPNGDTASIGYDGNARPSTSNGPFGALTSYTYSISPAFKKATTNGHWTKTTMDGFGRTILAETGDRSGITSQADTVYGPCGCSPLGKMSRQSMPHAPGGALNWTTYSYDAMGRTVSVQAPDNSTTSYLYQGRTVTVTDPAGKTKTFTMDAVGNLVTVQEPDPGLATVYTNYSYDVLSHLVTVSMPRGSDGSQTRTFNYGNPPGVYLLSATNPENGDGELHVQRRRDAGDEDGCQGASAHLQL